MNQDDRNQILELVSKNSYYYDYNQPEKRRTLFTSNVHTEMWTGGNQKNQSDSLDEFIENQTKRRNMLAEQRIQPRHYNTDVLLEEISEDLVIGTAMTMTTWQREGEKRPELVHTGVFDYEFVKTNVGWKISKRILHCDHD